VRQLISTLYNKLKKQQKRKSASPIGENKPNTANNTSVDNEIITDMEAELPNTSFNGNTESDNGTNRNTTTCESVKREKRTIMPKKYAETIRQYLEANMSETGKTIIRKLKLAYQQIDGSLPSDFPDDREIHSKTNNLKVTLKKQDATNT